MSDPVMHDQAAIRQGVLEGMEKAAQIADERSVVEEAKTEGDSEGWQFDYGAAKCADALAKDIRQAARDYAAASETRIQGLALIDRGDDARAFLLGMLTPHMKTIVGAVVDSALAAYDAGKAAR